jgi:type IV pilus assembly protein PilP
MSLLALSGLSKRCCLVSVLLITSACGETDVTDLNKFIQEVKARPKAAVPPLPENKVIESYSFKPDGLRDPFRPIEKTNADADLDLSAVSGIKPDLERRKEELEAYSLDSLRMVGTLTNQTGLWGLIKAKDGTIHRVQVGNHLGQNYGKITRILKDKMEIIEIVPEKPGVWREQQASLALAE